MRRYISDMMRADRNRLGKKILFYMLVVSSLFTAITSGFQIYTEYQRDINALQLKVENVIKTNEETLALAMWSLNLPLVETVFRGISLDPDFKYLAIVKRDSETPTFAVGQVPITRYLERIVPLSYTLQDTTTELERWIIHASYERVNGNIFKRGLVILVSQGFKTFVVSLLILFIINVLFTNRLLTIVKYLKEVDLSRSFSPLEVRNTTKSQDEIDTLVDSINTMESRLYAAYDDLSRFTLNLEALIKLRTEESEQKSRDLRGMLDNIHQGIFTIDKEHKVQNEYSRYMENIFENREIANRDAIDLLFSGSDVSQNQLDAVKSILNTAIGERAITYKANRHLFPTSFARNTPSGKKDLELSWQPITDDGKDVIEKLMVVVRDITELNHLRNETKVKDRELAIVTQILYGSIDSFENFAQSLPQSFNEIGALTKQLGTDEEAFPEILRILHTLKGNSAMLGYRFLVECIHEIERNLNTLRSESSDNINRTTVTTILDPLHVRWDEYANIFKRKFGRRVASHKDEMFDRCLDLTDKVADKSALKEMIFLIVSDIITRSRYSRVEEILLSMHGSVEKMAQVLGKAPPVIRVRRTGIMVRNSGKELLVGIFNHLLRNSADHGIELPKIREALGKPASGTISVDLAAKGDRVEIRFSDDGGGLNLEALRKKLEAKYPDRSSWSDEELAEVVFLAGMSTAATVSEISGWGVGMDAVRSALRRNSGEIRVEFTGPRNAQGYRPFAFVIELPRDPLFLEDESYKAA